MRQYYMPILKIKNPQYKTIYGQIKTLIAILLSADG